MRKPAPPPPLDELLQQAMTEDDNVLSVVGNMRPVDARGRYLHWDEVRHRTPPDGLTRERWWLGMALSRMAAARPLPLASTDGAPFRFSNTDQIQEMAHRIDQQASGQILSDEQVMTPRSSARYLVSSLEEEAITSSLLEGAATTRRIATELLRSGRRPIDQGERMILNNFNAMQAARELAEGSDPLTPDDVLELHRIVTADTLADEADVGRLQERDDQRVSVVWPSWEGELILHEPPPVAELPGRLANLCRFANEEIGEGFIHPVVRAIVLHFWVAYDHPFGASIEDDLVVLDTADYFSRPLRLTPPEALGLLSAGMAAAGLDPPNPALDRAVEKLTGALFPDASEALDAELPLEPEHLDALRRAAADRRAVRIAYMSGRANRTADRVVEPSMVHASLGWWYLRAHCRLAGDRRTFRVDRIRSLTVLEETFDAAPAGDPPTVAFTPSADSVYAVLALGEEARWVAEYYPVEIVSDGGGELVVRFAAADPRVTARLLIRLGDRARLVEGEEVSQETERLRRAILSRYGEA